MLRVFGATVRFGEVAALDAIDFTVSGSEVVAVMGPSGSGKSTLLRAIAGLEPLHAGSMSYDGVDLKGVPAHRRGFGLMFQDFALFPHRDVARNVAFGLEMQGRPDPDATKRVAEMLDLVGLSGMGGRSVATLSGGEQQRVALARTLAPSPRLVLLDEPLGSLDRTLSEKLIDDMRSIFEELGTPVIYVTHDRDEAFAIGDRVSIMRDGTIVRTDAPKELWDDPGSVFTAQLLGLENVFAASTVNGWEGGPSVATGRTVVIHPNGTTLHEDSPGITVRVVRDHFTAGAHRTVVATAEGSQIVVHSSRQWTPGRNAYLRIDEAAMTRVEGDPDR